MLDTYTHIIHIFVTPHARRVLKESHRSREINKKKNINGFWHLANIIIYNVL